MPQSRPMPRSPAARALPLVVVLTIIWGTNWSLFPLAVREVSVWTFRAISLAGAGVLLLAVRAMARHAADHPAPPLAGRDGAALIYLVIWNVASTYSAILIPSGQAAILGFTMPLWTVLFAWGLFGERPPARVLVAVALSAAGIGLLIVAARGAYADAPAGFLLGIFAGAGWALGTVILKRAAVPVPAIVLTGWQLLLAAVPLAIGAWALSPREAFVPSWQTVLVIGYMTVVPMAVGNAVWFAIVGLLPASVAGMSSVMVPIVAMVTGAIVHAEPLGAYQLGAMACCGAALFLALARK